MFALTRDAIEAHLTIVFAALAVSRAVQLRTEVSLRRVLSALRSRRSATGVITGAINMVLPALGPNEAAILSLMSSPDPVGS